MLLTILQSSKINSISGIPFLKEIIIVKNDIKGKILEDLTNKHIFVICKDIIDNPENSLKLDLVTHT